MSYKKNKIKINARTFLFLIVYTIFLGRAAIGNTTFSEYISIYGITLVILFSAGVTLLGIKMIFYDKISLHMLLLLLIIIMVFIIGFRFSTYVDILILLFLIIASNGLSLDDIVNCHFRVYLFVLISALLCSLLGIIDNFSIYSPFRGYRYALGNTYPTDFSAGTLYLMLDYVYLKRHSWKKRYSLMLVAMTITVYSITDTNTSLILSLLLSVGMFAYKTKWGYYIMSSTLCRKVIGLLFPLFAFASIYIQANYISLNSAVLFSVDKLLNNRISYGYMSIQKYGLSLFGQRIDMIGAGWGTNNSLEYFYIDSGYLQLALMYGIIFLLIFCAGFMMVCFLSNNKENHEETLVFIMFIISISGIVEPRFFSILYNPFIIAIGIYLYKYTTKRKVESNLTD